MIIEEVTEKLKAQDECDDYNLARGALRAFQRCDYVKAIKRFTVVIAESNKLRPRLLVKRAECLYKIEHHAEALKDLDCVLKADPGNLLALYLKGKVLFACHLIDSARDVFVELQKLTGGETDHFSVAEFIRFCDEKKERMENEGKRKLEAEAEARRKEEAEMNAKLNSACAPAPAKEGSSVPQVPAKIRHEWYQTDQSVIVTVLVKGMPKDCVRVEASENKLVVNLRFANDEKRTVELCTFHPILAEETSYKITPSKVEVNLKKIEAVRWDRLEAPPDETKTEPFRPLYPTSAKRHSNWDAVEQEVKKEEIEETREGDAALQKVFADIYVGSRASDCVSKAPDSPS